MKYVITSHNNFAIGCGAYHQDLAKGLTGNVVSAGYMKFVDGKIKVYGNSVGYMIDSKPEDAKLLEELLGIK